MFDMNEVLDCLVNEVGSAVKRVEEAKDLDVRLQESQIVLNLTRSMGVFFDMLETMPYDEDDDYDEDPGEQEDTETPVIPF